MTKKKEKKGLLIGLVLVVIIVIGLAFGSANIGDELTGKVGSRPDLKVTDIEYLQGEGEFNLDMIRFWQQNTGSKDVPKGKNVVTKVWANGTELKPINSRYIKNSNYLTARAAAVPTNYDLPRETSRVTVCIDTEQDISETNERNNCKTINF